MHHLWAEALAPLYAAGDTAKPGESTEKIRTGSVSWFALPTISMQNHQIVVQGVPVNAEVSLVSAIGTVVEKKTYNIKYGSLFNRCPCRALPSCCA